MKLSTTISISNMHLFDGEGRIKKYGSPEEILNEFYPLRLKYYEKRKQYLVDTLTKEWSKLDNKVRFILAVVKEEIIVRNRKKVDLLKELEDKGFTPFDTSKAKKKKEDEDDNGEEENEVDEKKKEKKKSHFDYLLSMPLWNLTWEKVEKLKKERTEKENEVKELLDTPVKTLWQRDLDNFVEALQEWYREEEEIEREGNSVKRNKTAKRTGKRRPTIKKKKDDSDDDFGTKPLKKEKKEEKTTVRKAPVVNNEKKTTAQNTLDSFLKKKSDSTEEAPKEVKKRVQTKGGKKITQSYVSSDSDGDEGLTLSQRIQKKTGMDVEHLSPEKKIKKRVAPEKSIDLISLDDEPPKKVKTASKKTTVKKFDFNLDEDEPTSPKNKAKKKSFVVDSDSDEEIIPLPRAKSTRTANKKLNTYKDSESEEDGGESSEDFQED